MPTDTTTPSSPVDSSILGALAHCQEYVDAVESGAEAFARATLAAARARWAPGGDAILLSSISIASDHPSSAKIAPSLSVAPTINGTLSPLLASLDRSTPAASSSPVSSHTLAREAAANYTAAAKEYVRAASLRLALSADLHSIDASRTLQHPVETPSQIPASSDATLDSEDTSSSSEDLGGLFASDTEDPHTRGSSAPNEQWFDYLPGDWSSNTNNAPPHINSPSQTQSPESAPPSGILPFPLRLRVLSQHSLWGSMLWNGARWLADWIVAHPGCYAHRSVVELGAAAALPSIVASSVGAAEYTLATDYPDEDLVANMRINIAAVDTLLARSRGSADLRPALEAEPFLWGDRAFLEKRAHSFDAVFLCDVVFNHSEHRRLLHSAHSLLRRPDQGAADDRGDLDTLRPHAWCVFSHYRPWLADKDLAFLQLARDAGWTVLPYARRIYPELLFPEDAADPRVPDESVMRTVHAYIMYPPRP